ncbi:hypothetical protein FO519_009441 [Halicephalobus sp. NKZ332]|nr:hypothetical protein FO519_009441 [Halicephalobus sp. NKZ332]
MDFYSSSTFCLPPVIELQEQCCASTISDYSEECCTSTVSDYPEECCASTASSCPKQLFLKKEKVYSLMKFLFALFVIIAYIYIRKRRNLKIEKKRKKEIRQCSRQRAYLDRLLLLLPDVTLPLVPNHINVPNRPDTLDSPGILSLSSTSSAISIISAPRNSSTPGTPESSYKYGYHSSNEDNFYENVVSDKEDFMIIGDPIPLSSPALSEVSATSRRHSR